MTEDDTRTAQPPNGLTAEKIAEIVAQSVAAAMSKMSTNGTSVQQQQAKFAIDKPEGFRVGADWARWKSKLENYFVGRSLPETCHTERRATLLSLLSDELYDTVNEKFGSELHIKDPKDIIAFLDTQLDAKETLMARRVEFRKLKESALGTGPKAFLASLRQKSHRCEFDKLTNHREYEVVMQYLQGIEDYNLRMLLIKQDELTIAKAEAITDNYMAIMQTSAAIEKSEKPKFGPAEVNHAGKFDKSAGKGRTTRCFKCGQEGHVAIGCRSDGSTRHKRDSEESDDDGSRRRERNDQKHDKRNSTNDMRTRRIKAIELNYDLEDYYDVHGLHNVYLNQDLFSEKELSDEVTESDYDSEDGSEVYGLHHVSLEHDFDFEDKASRVSHEGSKLEGVVGSNPIGRLNEEHGRAEEGSISWRRESSKGRSNGKKKPTEDKKKHAEPPEENQRGGRTHGEEATTPENNSSKRRLRWSKISKNMLHCWRAC